MGNIIEESWVYQEILQKGLEKGIQQGVQQGIQQGAEQERQETLRRQRQKILVLVQKRFPEALERAQKAITNLTDPDVLEDLLLAIGSAQNAQEVLSMLNETGKQEKK
ncbi:MAG: hypothetical protein JOZ18_19640 [Chloroflexi bacterium]|nr:hypothetical protein [Chloroflexota bacterium]